MDILDYLGKIDTPSESIKSQIMINIIEGRQYYKSNVDTFVVVEIPSCFYGKTATRKTTSPSYFKKFIIDLPTTMLNNLLSLNIIITVFESRNLPSLSKTLIGSAVIEMYTVWSEPNKSFHHKWLTLIDYGKHDLSVRGYLKCDLFMFYESKSIDNLRLTNQFDYITEDVEINENNLLIPNGFKIASTHLAKYSIKIYKSEISYLFDKGTKWLSIDFGEAHESLSIVLKISGTELNWNQEYSTINLYPPLCPTIQIKFIFSGKIMASRMLSMYDFIRKDGLPCFGPVFLHFMSLETKQYFGRIFMSVKTELVPSEVENVKSLQIDHIVPISNEVLTYFRIIIIGIVFCVDHVHKKLIKSNNMTISMDFGEYNFTSDTENKVEIINMQTPEYEVVNVEKNFYKLLIEEETKPCLYLVTHLPDVEYYAMIAMNLFSMTIYNMEECIFKTLEHVESQQSNIKKIKIVRKMLITLSSYYQRFKNLYDENINLQEHIHTSCVTYMRLFREYCLEEMKQSATLTYNESQVLTSVNKIKDMLKQLLVLHENISFNRPPNIFLNLCDGKTIVAKCEIQTRNFLYSNIPELKGKFCGLIRPLFLAAEKKDDLFDGIIETIFWIGPYEDFNLEPSNIPGLLFNYCNKQPCLQYRCKLFNKNLLQIKVHISQAVLTVKYFKQYGQLNLMSRVMCCGHSMTTEVINSNLSPSWNVSISFKPILLTQYEDTNEMTPIYIVIQLCHVQQKIEEIIENVIAFTVLSIKEIETPSHKTLAWYDIFDDSEKIGKICMTFEIIKVTEESLETVHESKVPLLRYVQPKLQVYRLIVLFWGLRHLKLQLYKPFIRMLCSSSYIDSDVIKKVNSFPNFPNINNRNYVTSIELPEDQNLIPPISFQLFTKSKLKKKPILIGVYAPQTIHQFMVPKIIKIPQKNERPAHSEIEKEEEENQNNITQINNKINSKINFSYICNFLKKTIDYIIPLCLKKINFWLNNHIFPIIISLFNSLMCLCPCINEIILFFLTKIKHLTGNFKAQYTLIENEFEEVENEFNWWTKYYGFKHQEKQNKKNQHLGKFSKIACKFLQHCSCCKESNEIDLAKHYSNIQSIIIYDRELESIPEFDRFEDNIKTFDIYGFNKNSKKPTTIAVLKANVHLYPNLISKDEQSPSRSKELFFPTTESQVWPGLKTNTKCNVIVRVYILRAHNLHPSDISGLSDSYIEILLGKSHRISDQKNYIPKSLNPIFGRCYEREISLPECALLKVKIMDYDRIGKNELIGETTIDLESRYYSKHRPHCGLPKQYNKDGYNRWRDSEKPSKILHKLCLLHSLKPPVYMKNSVLIGSKIFNTNEEIDRHDRQSLALNVLNHWQEMPDVGYHLVPEHVETRTLYNPNMPNLHQGTVEMWVDMFSKDDSLPAIVDVKPPTIEHYELRVIIWSVMDVKLVDDNFFTGEKHSDIYIKGWLPGVEKQSTDVHYRSLNGEGLFNWRFKFPFAYNKSENTIVYKMNRLFSLDSEEQQFLPRLYLQIWDNDHLSLDSYIGFLTLDLSNMPRGTKSPWRCTTSKKVPRINLFKIRKTRGWWPFISTENDTDSVVGKLDAEIQIMTKEEADKLPAGFGRDEPQPLPVPKRPSYQFLKTIMDPFKFAFHNIFTANKTKILKGIVIASTLLFLLLFIYAIPGYLVKKILNA